MKADIWYPRYVGDYHRDTMHLSTLQHGAYCLLMDAYWINQGPLSGDDAQLSQIAKLSLSDWSAIRSVIAKFFIIELGDCPIWRHKRIDKELEKALKQKESKSLAAKNTNVKRWGKQSHSESVSDSLSESQNGSQNGRSSPSPSPSVVAERERDFPECASNPKLKDVEARAQMIGLAPWKARDWFDEMEGCGWLDHQKRPVVNWQAILNRVRSKWEADGRPMSPPVNRSAKAKKPSAEPFFQR